VSAVWPNPEILPDYQGFDLVSLNGGNFEARNVPDVAAVADPETGVGIYVKDAGGWLQIGGTSASAPIWAGYVSILNSGAQYLFGTKNPVIGFL
jgi:subtilase family serine protease